MAHQEAHQENPNKTQIQLFFESETKGARENGKTAKLTTRMRKASPAGPAQRGWMHRMQDECIGCIGLACTTEY